jgi:hypothetical protein
MKLPPEIRLMIYGFAIHDNIASAISKADMDRSFRLPKRQPYLGALALIHTTSIIRKESRGAMYIVARHQWEDLCALSKLFNGEPMSALRFRSLSRCWKAMRQSQWVGDVRIALAKPRSTKPLHS